MGDLLWSRKRLFTFPLAALRHHAVCLGATGSGKTETLYRCAYGAYKVYRLQVIYLDAKGESKRAEEQEGDNAARFVATMQAAGARSIKVFPSSYYHGWQGTPTELQNRLLAVIDFSESQFYGDVAANAVFLALHTPTTPRNSNHFLPNLHPDRLKESYKDDPRLYERVLRLDKHLLAQVRMRYEVFFNAVRGQLDGELTYEDADAVYLRVRGFTLRQEAPRLGRFLVYDFMHYIAERRRSGSTPSSSSTSSMPCVCGKKQVCSLNRCVPSGDVSSSHHKGMLVWDQTSMLTVSWIRPIPTSCTHAAIPFRCRKGRANASA